MRKPNTLLLMSSVFTVSLLLGGCSSLAPVNPWEKGDLAKPEMTFEGDPLEGRFVQHIYTSKESSSGGYGVGGGGCGCN